MSYSDYWLSPAGIEERLVMLADTVKWSTFNNALKVYGTAVGVTDWKIAGGLKPGSCEWCKDHVGRIYHRGQFLPILPKHLGCPHFLDPLRIGAKPTLS